MTVTPPVKVVDAVEVRLLEESKRVPAKRCTWRACEKTGRER